MGGGAEHGGERQNCGDFDCDARDGSSDYLQFAPIRPMFVADILPYEHAR
jgi:hypothetical protein